MQSLPRWLILSLTILLATASLVPSEALATVTTTTARNQYTGNGAITVYPYTFRILASTDLQVLINDVVQPSGFTVSGVGASAGGNVTFSAAPANGASVVFLRNVPITQQTDYVQNAPLPAETLERDLDKGAMVDQELQEQINRAVLLPPSSTLTGVRIPPPGAGNYIRWNGAGTQLEATSAVLDSGNFLQSGTGAVTRSVTSKLSDIISVKDFGAVGDGVADDTAEILNAFHAAPGGATIYFPNGQYVVDGTLTLDRADVRLWFAGDAWLAPTAGWGIRVQFPANNGRVVLDGVKVRINTGSTATRGIWLDQAPRVTMYTPVVWAFADIPANFVGIDVDDFSFWCEIFSYQMRKDSGGVVGTFARGIRFIGQSNAGRVWGGNIAHADVGVYADGSNAITVIGTAMENVTTAVEFAEATAGGGSVGGVVVGMRLESVTNGVNLSLTTFAAFTAPYLVIPGHIGGTPTFANYVLNPNGWPVYSAWGTEAFRIVNTEATKDLLTYSSNMTTNTARISVASGSISMTANGNAILSGDMDASGAGEAQLAVQGVSRVFLQQDGTLRILNILFANLPASTNGSVVYCSDCTFANPCAGAGTGAFAKRLAGTWRCD